MAGLRHLDAFVKTRPELQESKSFTGGLLTLVAAIVSGTLFLSQLTLYIIGHTEHSLHMAPSISIPLLPLNPNHFKAKLLKKVGKIPLDVLVTFPHLQCSQLDVVHDGAALSTGELEKVHEKHSLVLRSATTSEMDKIMGRQLLNTPGCTVSGHLNVPIVAGYLGIGMDRNTWAEATSAISLGLLQEETTRNEIQRYNVSHYIHHVRFGEPFPQAETKPLEERAHIIQNKFGGIALEQIQVKLVQTFLSGIFSSRRTFQASVVDHTVQPQTLVARGVPHLPGVVFTYDFTPLAVTQTSGRENILVFISSLVSIVAGVYVTVGLLSGCLLHSAKAVAKKID